MLLRIVDLVFPVQHGLGTCCFRARIGVNSGPKTTYISGVRSGRIYQEFGSGGSLGLVDIRKMLAGRRLKLKPQSLKP